MFTTGQCTGNHLSVIHRHSGSTRGQGWKPNPTGNSPKSKFLEGAPSPGTQHPQNALEACTAAAGIWRGQGQNDHQCQQLSRTL